MERGGEPTRFPIARLRYTKTTELWSADRFGDGDDVQLENATLQVSITWGDSPARGYVVSCTVDSPTQIPNDWTGDADQLFCDLWHAVVANLESVGVGTARHKDSPI